MRSSSLFGTDSRRDWNAYMCFYTLVMAKKRKLPMCKLYLRAVPVNLLPLKHLRKWHFLKVFFADNQLFSFYKGVILHYLFLVCESERNLLQYQCIRVIYFRHVSRLTVGYTVDVGTWCMV